MLDHMLFNRLKWFNIDNNSQQITANGKKWGAYPTSVKLNGTGALASDLGLGNVIGTPNCECYAKIANRFGTYYVVNYEGRMAFIKDDQIASENWEGGKSLLIHFYQALRAITRKVVAL
nr:MAG TPA: Tryptophanase operon leader peptide [Caudoviricetes sp.]